MGALHDVHGLADEDLGARFGVGAPDRDPGRIALVALRDRRDPCRHRRREQHGLAVVGRALENRLDVVGEAHVEHLVGLVEDDGTDRVESQRTPADVVEGTSRGGDDDVDAAVECLELALDRLATEHGNDLDAEFARRTGTSPR